jgi:hypothetical protein
LKDFPHYSRFGYFAVTGHAPIRGIRRRCGGSSVEGQSNKMANTVDRNNQLRKTYNAVNVASVRRFDKARAIGAKILEQRATKRITAPALVTILEQRRNAKSLK